MFEKPLKVVSLKYNRQQTTRYLNSMALWQNSGIISIVARLGVLIAKNCDL